MLKPFPFMSIANFRALSARSCPMMPSTGPSSSLVLQLTESKEQSSRSLSGGSSLTVIEPIRNLLGYQHSSRSLRTPLEFQNSRPINTTTRAKRRLGQSAPVSTAGSNPWMLAQSEYTFEDPPLTGV